MRLIDADHLVGLLCLDSVIPPQSHDRILSLIEEHTPTVRCEHCKFFKQYGVALGDCEQGVVVLDAVRVDFGCVHFGAK